MLRPPLATVALAVLVLGLPAAAPAFAEPGPTPPADRRVINRTIEPDGSLRIEYSDGTTVVHRRPAGDGAAEPATDPATPPAGGPRKTLPMPRAPDPVVQNARVLEKYAEASAEYYQYLASGYRYRHQVFQWQLFSSRVIFAVVLVLVFSGILFAGTQFYVGLRRAKPGALPADAVTEFEASLRGVKVSSPILGVIVLAISLAFFYLYLVYVYPISDIF